MSCMPLALDRRVHARGRRRGECVSSALRHRVARRRAPRSALAAAIRSVATTYAGRDRRPRGPAAPRTRLVSMRRSAVTGVEEAVPAAEDGSRATNGSRETAPRATLRQRRREPELFETAVQTRARSGVGGVRDSVQRTRRGADHKVGADSAFGERARSMPTWGALSAPPPWKTKAVVARSGGVLRDAPRGTPCGCCTT